VLQSRITFSRLLAATRAGAAIDNRLPSGDARNNHP